MAKAYENCKLMKYTGVWSVETRQMRIQKVDNEKSTGPRSSHLFNASPFSPILPPPQKKKHLASSNIIDNEAHALPKTSADSYTACTAVGSCQRKPVPDSKKAPDTQLRDDCILNLVPTAGKHNFFVVSIIIARACIAACTMRLALCEYPFLGGLRIEGTRYPSKLYQLENTSSLISQNERSFSCGNRDSKRFSTEI